jgi:hypothetical protein
VEEKGREDEGLKDTHFAQSRQNNKMLKETEISYIRERKFSKNILYYM